jgi:hypothetical protein
MLVAVYAIAHNPTPPNFTQRRSTAMDALEWNDAALAKYLASNTTLQDEIKDLSAHEQKQQTQWAFEDEAEALGIETWEFALQWIAETPEQLKEMRLEAHRQVAEALGMEWAEYCAVNAIQE